MPIYALYHQVALRNANSFSRDFIVWHALAVPKFCWKCKVAMFHLWNRFMCCLDMKY